MDMHELKVVIEKHRFDQVLACAKIALYRFAEMVEEDNDAACCEVQIDDEEMVVLTYHWGGGTGTRRIHVPPGDCRVGPWSDSLQRATMLEACEQVRDAAHVIEGE